jgi:glycolate oxidase
MDTKILREVEEEIYKCMKCGECQEVCPVFKHGPRESFLARGKIRLLKGVLTGELEVTPALQEKVDKCLHCNACLSNCPPGVDTEKIMVKARQQMRANHLPLDAASQALATSLMDNNNPFNAPAGERETWLPPGVVGRTAEYAFFAGCSISYSQNKTGKALLRLLDSCGIVYTALGNAELCCGDPLIRMGYVDRAEKNLAENHRNLKAKGVKTVFTLCSGCAKTLKHRLGEGFEVLHAVEFLEKLLDDGKLVIEKELAKTVIYHDGCDLGRHCGVYEAQRNVLKRIPGIKLVEFAHNRTKADCCGGPFMAPYPQDAQDIASVRLQGAVDQGAEIVVTTCPSCFVNLKNGLKLLPKAKLDIQDLVLLLQRLVKQK